MKSTVSIADLEAKVQSLVRPERMEHIRRVAELAEQRGVSMTEIALAWLLSKVSAPIVGATKSSQIEGAARAVDLELTEAEIRYLEERYQPHRLVGVMAENGGR